MILVAGATGTLGKQLIPLLQSSGSLRAVVRDPASSRDLAGVEVVHGDVRDPEVLRRAVAGVEIVVSALSGFGASGDVSVESIDRDACRNLVDAAAAAGVRHFVLVSAWQASPRHPMDLMKAKAAAEAHLKASQMTWTILRPTLSTETWTELLGRPLLQAGKTTVFGRGNQPVNFVSARDVARFVALAVTDPAMRGLTLEVGGSENLTMNQFVARFQEVTGVAGSVAHYPLPVMRVLAIALRPIKQQMSRHIQAGIHIDTSGFAFDGVAARTIYPGIPFTSIADVFRLEHGEPAASRSDHPATDGVAAAL